MEGVCPFADGHIRILSEKEVNLLEGSSVGLDTVKATHVNDRGGYFAKLVHSRDVFSITLPHVPVHQGELYFSCHICFVIVRANHANILISLEI